jgi:hypothetical protein
MYTDAYALAIRPEQIEKAISVAVAAKFNRPQTSLEDCVEAAVEQVFCPCVSYHEGEGETPSMSIRTGIVGSIVEYLRAFGQPENRRFFRGCGGAGARVTQR